MSDGQWHSLRPLKKLLLVRATACNVFFIDAQCSHGPPLVMVAGKPYLGNALKLPVFSNVFGRKMAMIIDNGQVFGGVVVESLGVIAFQQKVPIHKWLNVMRHMFNYF